MEEQNFEYGSWANRSMFNSILLEMLCARFIFQSDNPAEEFDYVSYQLKYRCHDTDVFGTLAKDTVNNIELYLKRLKRDMKFVDFSGLDESDMKQIEAFVVFLRQKKADMLT